MIVVHDLDEPRGQGAQWGEVQANIHRALGCVGVLTDGSGSSGQGRLESTTRLLERIGSRPGPIYGRISDRDIYNAILDRNLDLFRGLTDELCDAFVTHDATCVVGDSIEGYNPSHDVCRLTINAAVVASRPRCTRMGSNMRHAERPDEMANAMGRRPRCRCSMSSTAWSRGHSTSPARIGITSVPARTATSKLAAARSGSITR